MRIPPDWYIPITETFAGKVISSFEFIIEQRRKILAFHHQLIYPFWSFIWGGNDQTTIEPTPTPSYFLHKRCTGGSKIRDAEDCKSACNELDITLSSSTFKDGKPCYKGGNGQCSQNGRNGQLAIFVCTYEGNLLHVIYLHINKYDLCKMKYRFISCIWGEIVYLQLMASGLNGGDGAHAR